jgi:mannose-binding lectin 2
MQSIILVLLLAASVAVAERLNPQSFEPPFAEVDHSGERIVGRQWRSSGSTKVLNNYVRLTPDRQSKQGALWSRKSLGVPAMSSVLKFRISGQGKNFFGDGLAMWIVQQGYYSEGTLHGFHEKFVGIGIIFDTFKNTENLAAHRDVTILVNDGEKTYEQMTEDVQGCNINVRYHADRADFSVTDSSRAKIVIDGEYMNVLVDPRNTGDWEKCANVSLGALDPEWLRKAHVGLTATTGQLADNHDVISFVAYSDNAVMEDVLTKQKEQKLFELKDADSPDDKLLQLEAVVNSIFDKLEFLDHHIEHELAGLEDGVQNLNNKLKEQREKPEIENLDEIVQKQVDGSFQDKISKTEKKLTDEFEKKMIATQRTVDRLKAAKSSEGGGGDGGYKTPFYLLLVLVLGGGVGMYIFYQKMLSKWKLP